MNRHSPASFTFVIVSISERQHLKWMAFGGYSSAPASQVTPGNPPHDSSPPLSPALPTSSDGGGARLPSSTQLLLLLLPSPSKDICASFIAPRTSASSICCTDRTARFLLAASCARHEQDRNQGCIPARAVASAGIDTLRGEWRHHRQRIAIITHLSRRISRRTPTGLPAGIEGLLDPRPPASQLVVSPGFDDSVHRLVPARCEDPEAAAASTYCQ